MSITAVILGNVFSVYEEFGLMIFMILFEIAHKPRVVTHHFEAIAHLLERKNPFVIHLEKYFGFIKVYILFYLRLCCNQGLHNLLGCRKMYHIYSLSSR